MYYVRRFCFGTADTFHSVFRKAILTTETAENTIDFHGSATDPAEGGAYSACQSP